MITHRLATIRNADKIYVLDNGHIIEHGTHETLMGKEGSKYQSMVKNQQSERMEDNENHTINRGKIVHEDEKHIGTLLFCAC